jgi:hydrogenase nickel incorporation protein HypA/HybF
MHEMSLALEIRSICERALEKRPEERLTALGIEVGAFSGVEVNSLQFCLEVVMAERFDGVRCEIHREAGVAACPACSLEFEVTQAPFECPKCGSLAWGVSGGQGLQLSYIDVE